MRTKLLVLAAAGLMAMGTGAGTMVGCSANGTASYHPPASQLKQGVNLLEAKDAAWGVNTAFVSGSRVVYVETRVGPLKPDVYRQSWPDDPPNEMDMRFVDQNGNTFYVMRGGDNIIDPTWAEELSKTAAANRLVPKAERDLDWKLAQQGATAVAAALPAEFKDHVFHLAAFGQQKTPAEDPMIQAKEARIAATPLPSGQTAYGSFGYGNWSWLETDKFSAATGCALWICAASHSATNMWDCEWNGSSCSWALVIVANNHGRSPSQLNYDCYANGGWYNSSMWVNGSTAGGATGAYDGAGGCQTAYSWSGSNNEHLCNDDAAYELWQAKGYTGHYNDRYNHLITQTTQGDAYNFSYYGNSHCDGDFCGESPSVFSCNYPNGDWNTPGNGQNSDGSCYF